MPNWNKQKVNASDINGGREFETRDMFEIDTYNAVVNNSLFASETVEGMGVGGEYNSSSTYKYPNIVSYQGSSYMAIYKTNNEYAEFSNVLPTNATYWKLLAQAGTVSFDNLTDAQKAELKGEEGSMIVSTELVGQDAEGGNIYEQTFNNGVTSQFTARRGPIGETGARGPQGPSGLSTGATLSNEAGTSELNGYTQYAVNNLVSNPNLLLNGDFSVNSGGASSYSGVGKTVDNWEIFNGGSLIYNDDHSVTLNFTTQYQAFKQIIDNWYKFKGKPMTISCKVRNVSTGAAGLYLRCVDGVTSTATRINADGIFTHTFTVSDDATKLDIQIFTGAGSGSVQSLTVEWAKLEIGSVATAFTPLQKQAEESLIKGCAVSNPNLLINGDFRVNQRGKTEYTGTAKYTVDRWWINNDDTVTVLNQGIKYSTNQGWRYVWQKVEDFAILRGKTVILSAKISSVSYTTGIPSLILYDGKSYSAAKFTSDGVFSVTKTIASDATELNIRIGNYSGNETLTEISIEWVKLEVGSVATAYSPRPYAEELALCQRYYIKYPPTLYYGCVDTAKSSHTLIINTPVDMRALQTVTIIYSSSNIRYNGQYISITGYTYNSSSRNYVRCTLNTEQQLTSGTPIVIWLYQVEIDAEL